MKQSTILPVTLPDVHQFKKKSQKYKKINEKFVVK